MLIVNRGGGILEDKNDQYTTQPIYHFHILFQKHTDIQHKSKSLGQNKCFVHKQMKELVVTFYLNGTEFTIVNTILTIFFFMQNILFTQLCHSYPSTS